MTRHDVRIFPDAEELAAAAADEIVAEAREAVAARGRFLWALCGGGAARRVYAALAAAPRREAFPWSRTEFFWSDERYVPPDHPGSNYRLAREVLLAGAAGARLHPVPVGEATVEAAAAAYERTVRAFLGGGAEGFDLLLLGVGEDGHTASLFPGRPELDEESLWVAPVNGSPKPPARRVTFTLPLINRSARAIFVAEGEAKSAVLGDILGGRKDFLPAARVRPAGEPVAWRLDKKAAANL